MIFLNFQEIQDFSRKTRVFKKIKVFQGFCYLGLSTGFIRLVGSGVGIGVSASARRITRVSYGTPYKSEASQESILMVQRLLK